ncbi:MAG: RluA family pseudouridine synthase [Vicinamibacteria bacterium]|nr:RluA family pseudouridine synthase [Vicinamibacteria bacterium]
MSAGALNSGFTYVERVGPGDAGRTLLEHLVRRHTHSDVSTWMARVAAGEVDVDGAAARPDTPLRAGQRVTWRRPPWVEPAVPLEFAVVFEDAHLLAIDKPSGLPSVPAGGFLEHTALHLVRRTHPAAAPLHRLGRGTSGLLLFALSDRARRALAADWRTGRVRKVYRALAQGSPDRDEWSIDAPIGPIEHPRLGHVHARSAAGRPALSHVRVLERRADATLVEVRIETGRPHQIRIHLATSGHPLVGDPLYAAGGGLRKEPALPGAGGYLLHAHQLTFDHPDTRTRLELEARPPARLEPAAKG